MRGMWFCHCRAAQLLKHLIVSSVLLLVLLQRAMLGSAPLRKVVGAWMPSSRRMAGR